jgi:tetratricopeptide (TPR) repeat protein
LFGILALLSAPAINSATAKDDPLEFVHLLQREGYADVAIDYLDQLKSDPNTPKEIMDLWDLEMSRSKKEAVKLAYSDAQAKQWADDSKALLERFIKGNPNRPEAIQEAARWSEEQAVHAQSETLRAGYVTDKAEKAKLLADARKIFEEIRPRFVAAEKASANLLASLPKNAPRSKRETAAIMVGDNRLTVAMVDFYLAQTREATPQRTEELNKLIKVFDAIYQEYREAFLGWRAHFWHGRILQELGQLSDAKAIYEEVAACDERNIEELGESKVAVRAKSVRRTGLEDFFAEVEQYYLQVLYQTANKDYREYLEEVATWRNAHKANSQLCNGYQALTMECAKNLVEMSKQAKDDNSKKLRLRQALQLFNEMAKTPGPYQEDAVKLRRQLNPASATEVGFEEAVIDGDNMVEKKKWAEAILFYEKAIAAATAKTDQQRLAGVQNTLVGCYHNLAMQLYQKAKIEEAIATAQKALKPNLLQTKTAPGVAVFLLNVQYYQYLGAAEGTEAEKKAKSELLAKVSKTAKAILSKKEWAAKEEGDSARVVLLRLAMAQDNMAEADKILSEINPSSKEYSKALTVMGFAHWYRYKVAKRQIDAELAGKTAIDKDRIAKRDDDRKQAVDYTDKAVNALVSRGVPEGAMPESLRESKLLLAEIYSEGKDFKQAVSHYKPLVDELLKDTGKAFDDTTLRILDGAGLAYLQLGDIDNVAAVGGRLVESGPDQGPVNVRIMSFSKGLETKRKDFMTENESADPTGQVAAKLKSLTDLQEKIMINLSKRDKLSPASMIWIVKTASNLGTDDGKAAAAELIERIIDKANNDQGFNEEIKKAKAQLESLGAILHAQRGEYDKAKTLIDQLIQTYPRALEPRVSKARILTEWAAKDSSKYGEAITAWDSLRKKLEGSSAKSTAPKSGEAKKVDPKYDVILNEADCFYKLAQKTKSKEDARTGMNLLTPYFSLDPNILAPSDEYKELSVRYFQLGIKLADFLNVPRPVRPKAKRASSP